MISIVSFLIFIGFYTLYYTSQKTYVSYEKPYEKWIQENTKPCKYIGVLVLLSAFFLLVFEKALGSGTLLFFIQLMTIGSLIIILSPLKIIKPLFVILLFVAASCIEYYN
ncbi:MAG: hypothetical protein ABI554_06645 [Flavobacterium sp.]